MKQLLYIFMILGFLTLSRAAEIEVKVELTYQGTPINPGDPIPIDITIKNVSEKPQSVIVPYMDAARHRSATPSLALYWGKKESDLRRVHFGMYPKEENMHNKDRVRIHARPNDWTNKVKVEIKPGKIIKVTRLLTVPGTRNGHNQLAAEAGDYVLVASAYQLKVIPQADQYRFNKDEYLLVNAKPLQVKVTAFKNEQDKKAFQQLQSGRKFFLQMAGYIDEENLAHLRKHAKGSIFQKRLEMALLFLKFRTVSPPQSVEAYEKAKAMMHQMQSASMNKNYSIHWRHLYHLRYLYMKDRIASAKQRYAQ